MAISRSNDATFKRQLGSVLAGAGWESKRAGGVNVSCVRNVRGMGKNEVTITAQSWPLGGVGLCKVTGA